MSVDRAPRALTKAERRQTGRVSTDIADASGKWLLKPKWAYCVRSATDTDLHMAGDGVTTSVNTDRVTKETSGPRAAQPSAVTDGKAKMKETTTEAVQDSRKTGPSRENEKEYVIEKLVEHTRT